MGTLKNKILQERNEVIPNAAHPRIPVEVNRVATSAWTPTRPHPIVLHSLELNHLFLLSFRGQSETRWKHGLVGVQAEVANLFTSTGLHGCAALGSTSFLSWAPSPASTRCGGIHTYTPHVN